MLYTQPWKPNLPSLKLALNKTLRGNRSSTELGGNVKYWGTRIAIFSLLLMICPCFTSLGGFARGYVIPTDVINGGGREGTSANYKLHDSAGQPVTGGLAQSNSFRYFTGFWYTLSIPSCHSWCLPLTITATGVMNTRTFGVHCNGTDGYDEGLDVLIPPPGFDFYSYFHGVAPFNYLSTDIRSSEDSLITWNLVIVNNPDSFIVIWDSLSLPDSGYFTIGDTAHPTDMRVRNSATFCCEDMNVQIHYKLYLEGIRDKSGPAQVPVSFNLEQNYPNPFNPTTEIRYALPRDSYVRIEVYNLTGQRVATLIDENQRAGYKSVQWNVGRLASGIYFYRIQAGDFVKTRKMVLLK